MFKNKPVTLLIAAGLMILLIAAAGVYPLIANNIRGGMIGGMGVGNRPAFQDGGTGQFPGGGNPPSGGNFPSGTTRPEGTFQQGEGQFTQGGPQGNFSGTMPAGASMNIKVLQLLRGLQTIGAIIIIAFGALSILGIMLSKRWGRKLAIATSILAILFTIAGMFSFMMGLILVVKIIALALSIAIFILCLLPKSRTMATVPA